MERKKTPELFLSLENAIKNISNSMGESAALLYSHSTSPIEKKLSNITKGKKKVRIKTISDGKIRLPYQRIKYISAVTDVLNKLVYLNLDSKMDSAFINGIDEKDLIEYLRIHFVKNNIQRGITEINYALKELTRFNNEQVIGSYYDTFSKLAEGRVFELKDKDGNTRKVEAEDACEIYQKYLDMKKFSSMDKVLNLVAKLGIEGYSIFGNFTNKEKTKSLTGQWIIFFAFKGFMRYLGQLKKEDQQKRRDLVSIVNKWEEFFSKTKLTTPEEMELIIQNINDILGDVLTYEMKVEIYDFLLEMQYGITRSIIMGQFIYNRLKGKGKIGTEDIAKVLLECTQIENLSESFLQIWDLLTSIKIEEKDKVERKQIEYDLKQLLMQAKVIEELKSPDKKFNRLTIKKGKISPINRDWYFECEEDITIESGQILYVEGNSGNGKTSFFETILLGEPKSKGIMRADDKDIDKLEEQVAVYEKDKAALPNGESILVKITSKLNPSEDDKVIVESILRDVGYEEDNLDSNKDKSLGQVERLLIAKMLYRMVTDKKPIAIFDEPIGQVETGLKEKLMQAICNYAREYGIIVMIASHEKELVQKYADVGMSIEGKEEEIRTIKPFQIIKENQDEIAK